MSTYKTSNKTKQPMKLTWLGSMDWKELIGHEEPREFSDKELLSIVVLAELNYQSFKVKVWNN